MDDRWLYNQIKRLSDSPLSILIPFLLFQFCLKAHVSAGRFIFDLDCLRSLSVTNPFPKSLLRVLRCRHQALTKILSDLITLNSCFCSKGYKPLCRAPSSLETSREASEVRILNWSEFFGVSYSGLCLPLGTWGQVLGVRTTNSGIRQTGGPF